MLYHLFDLLKDFDIPGQRLMNYLSFRALMASAISLISALWLGRKTIDFLQKKQIGETIRDLGLEGQMQKKGTPTMGGIIIIFSTLIGTLLFANLSSIYTILLIVTMVWLGGLGFADDYIKVFRHNKEGLSEKAKLAGQGILALGIGLTVCFSEQVDTFNLVTTIPFVAQNEFDYSWLSPFSGQLGVWTTWAIYTLVMVLVILACSNSVNLTDGMDGLAAGTTAIVGVVIGIFAWISSSVVNSDYLNIMSLPGSGEVTVFMASMVGALLGFLWYNCFPAQVFMGDTGSLALGGVIGVSAILIHKELLLPILCGIFFVEALSVIIQRNYFRYTRKKYGTGRRVFKMAPLHHHFQKEGVDALVKAPRTAIPEAKIVTRFYLVGILLAIFTVALLKVR